MSVISKTDLAALRKADSIVFHHDRPGDRVNGTAGRIRCLKRLSAREQEQDPFAPDSREYGIDCESWIKFPGDSIPKDCTPTDFRDKLRAAEVMSVYRFHNNGSVLSTVIDLIRANDTVKLSWYYDAGNNYTQNGGLHSDMLELHIERPGKKQSKHFAFLLRYSVCPDNSARMISQWR